MLPSFSQKVRNPGKAAGVKSIIKEQNRYHATGFFRKIDGSFPPTLYTAIDSLSHLLVPAVAVFVVVPFLLFFSFLFLTELVVVLHPVVVVGVLLDHAVTAPVAKVGHVFLLVQAGLLCVYNKIRLYGTLVKLNSRL